MPEERSGLEQLSPELRDLTEMEAAAMCREMQRLAGAMTRAMVEGATRLAMELLKDPERLKEYMDKFGLEEKPKKSVSPYDAGAKR